MNIDKAYLLGLIIGGGIWGNAEDNFRIRLPFKQWGSCEKEPQRAGQISQDILRVVSPMFRNTYSLSISYTATVSGEWNILCEGDLSNLQTDLKKYGIVCEGELRKSVQIDKIISDLVDDNLKRRFIAGLADTIGSTKSSHRRFTEDKQIISFEIQGFGYKFVCSLCRLLHSIKCYPDQVLWNHPNMHCTSNPFDNKWKKGFKLRVLADQYANFGAFSFTSKALSLQQNRKLEKIKSTADSCNTKIYDLPTPSCVHPDEYSELLPSEIKDGHYMHNRHFCAVMGCEHAPYGQITALIQNAEVYVNPFPILAKGTVNEISNIIKSNKLFFDRNYKELNIKISIFYKQYSENANSLLFGNGKAGYPINQVMKAITFLIAAKLGLLKGSRPKGSMYEIVNGFLTIEPNATVKIDVPNLLTPIILSLGDYSAIVGANNPAVYKKLINISPDNPYKIIARSIKESDLK